VAFFRWRWFRRGLFALALALASLGYTLYSWWPLTPRCTVRGDFAVKALALSADGRVLTTASGDLISKGPGKTYRTDQWLKDVQTWDTDTGRPRHAFLQKIDDPILNYRYSPDGRFLTVLTAERVLRLVDLVENRETLLSAHLLSAEHVCGDRPARGRRRQTLARGNPQRQRVGDVAGRPSFVFVHAR
jgi:WD40 repeat protein